MLSYWAGEVNLYSWIGTRRKEFRKGVCLRSGSRILKRFLAGNGTSVIPTLSRDWPLFANTSSGKAMLQLVPRAC